MEDLTVTLFLVESTGILTELDRVKMSGRGGGRQGGIAWSGNSLAIITGDLFVRIWDIERSDNYLLKMDLPSGNQLAASLTSLSNGTMSSSNQFFSHDSSESSSVPRKTPKYGQMNGEIFTCLAYSSTGQTLCAGTSQGNLFTWKRSGSRFVSAPEDAWQLTNISSVRGAIRSCEWGFNELAKPCMLVNCLSNVFMLKEQPLLAVHTRELWAVQRSAKSVQLTHCSGRETTVQSEFAVTAMALNELSLVMSNGRSISSYSLQKVEKSLDEFDEILENVEGAAPPTTGSTATPLSVKLLQTFPAECLCLDLYNQNIFCLSSSDVMVYSVGGVVLHRMQASDIEGKIIGMDLSGCYLSVFTMNGYVKVYDVSRHDPKLLFPSKSGHDIFDDFGEFILVKCNSLGSHLAMVIASSNFTPISALFCWDFERNNLFDYGLLEQETSSKKEISSSSLPVRVFWDAEEPRLLAVEVKSMMQKSAPQKNSPQPIHFVQSKILLLFYSEKGSLNLLESQPMSPGSQLLNLCVPNVIRLKINAMEEQPLQDFVDLQQCDPVTRKQVLNFSLYVAEGNMDLAYRSIRSIQSKVIWTNLAKMCVHTNRLDVAKVCMGHLEQARSVRALRQAIEDDDLETEAKVAVLAIELGMIEEAKDLYRQCKRFDLLNKLLQSIGHLDEALQLAETEDRIHLKHTYYQKAQELRERGDIKGALEFFEKTQNPAQNITQLLLENPAAMKRYIQTTSDPKLLKWWGQYIESSGDMDAALAVYHKAEDWFSQVNWKSLKNYMIASPSSFLGEDPLLPGQDLQS